jgi:glycosyltransferase 2 family protein
MTGRARYVGFAVTLVFVALLVWKIDLHEVTSALARANYLYVAPAVVTTLTSYCLRTLRWGRILRPIRALRFRVLLPVVFIGFMANNLLPARIGELVRAYALGQKTTLSKSLGLATILLERLFDGITLVAVLGLIALLYPLPDWARQAAYVAGGLFLVAAVAAVAVLTRRELTLRILVVALAPLPRLLGEKVQSKAESFIGGLEVLRSGRDLLAIAAWSIIIWTVECLTYVVVIRGVHPALQSGTPLLAAMLMMAMVNLGSLIPSAPGYVGVFQGFAVLALSAFGVPPGVALAIAILAHIVQWVVVTGIGLLFWTRESLALGSIGRAGDSSEGMLAVGSADAATGGVK